MQFLKVPYDLITDTKITSNEFRIYTYLMSRFNENKNCAYPSIDVIAAKVGLSTRTVISCIKNLVKLGYMKITKKKGIWGNYNEYSDLKYLVGAKEENKVPANKEGKKVPKIVSDCKESGVQLEILNADEEVPKLSEYTRLHQQKISLVQKLGIALTEKQKNIIGDFDIEVLRESIRTFRKKKGRFFSFLMNLYLDIASRNNKIISKDIKKYSKYIELTPEEVETQIALMELQEYGVPVF